MKPTDLKFISTLTYLGQTYHIARNQHGYWAINAEYVDDQNRVTRELTGMECHLSDTYEDCVRNLKVCRFCIDWMKQRHLGPFMENMVKAMEAARAEGLLPEFAN